MVLDPIPQILPVHFFGSRPQPPTSPYVPHPVILQETDLRWFVGICPNTIELGCQSRDNWVGLPIKRQYTQSFVCPQKSPVHPSKETYRALVRGWNMWKETIYPQMSPTYPQKSPTDPQKSPTDHLWEEQVYSELRSKWSPSPPPPLPSSSSSSISQILPLYIGEQIKLNSLISYVQSLLCKDCFIWSPM